MIYRDDGLEVCKAKAGKQCYKNWFYRKQNTAESEAGFQLFEDDWATLVENIRGGKSDNALVFMQILMYHFRNISIQNHSDMDRYEAVSLAVVNWIEQNVFKLPKGERLTDDPTRVTKFPWQVRLITQLNAADER